MTSGVVGDPYPSPYALGIGFRRSWSGGDGKTTTFAGVLKDKWNNYTCSVNSWRRSNLTWSMIISHNQTFPPNGVRISEVFDRDDGFGFQSPSIEWTSNDQLKLLDKLIARVKDHQFNLAVNLGQLHQTVDLLSSNLQKLGRAALALKRGQFATAARQLGARPRGTRLKTSDISGRWLELQYGWLPLLGDSFEAAKAFEAISNGPRTQLYRTSHKQWGQDNGSQSPTFFDLPYKWRRTKYIQYECTEEMGPARQLGLLDPLSVAWELLPWSFVVDWFVPIGSYLDLVNQVPALKGRFLTTEVLRQEALSDKVAILARFREIFEGGTFQYKIDSVTKIPALSGRQVVMNRVYSESLSVPLPTMHLGGAVHGRRLWNAISLAQQRFGRVIDAELNAVSLARITRTRYRSRLGRPGI